MRSFLVLFVALCLQTPNSAQTVSSTPTSTEILRAAVKAIEKAEAVEYEVRRGALKPSDPIARLQTTIVLTRDPLRFLAKTTNENGQVVAMAVSDGKTTRTSSDGKVGEHPTFARDGKTMGATTLPNADVAVTRQWFDPNFLNEAINSQRTILLRQSEVEGELCHIIFYARPTSSPDFISTQYAWISATTGLPHALQILSISRGNSGLGSRLALSKIHINHTDANILSNSNHSGRSICGRRWQDSRSLVRILE